MARGHRCGGHGMQLGQQRCISRWHGYEDPDAPESLRYDLAYEVDLRDSPDSPEWSTYGNTNSSLYPWEEDGKKGTWGFDYGALFSAEWADRFGIQDPDDPGRNLPLCDLLDRGFVHEVWVYGDADHPLPGDASAAEILEWKPKYDEAFVPTGKMHGCAGNGCFDPEDLADILAAGCKRTIRIAWFNNTRGPGCFMESLSHGLESMATTNVLPWLAPYFRDFANMEMNVDYGDQGIQLASRYACEGGDQLSYPDPTTVDYGAGCGGPGQITGYDPVCGNVHFMPDSKGHYDLTSDMPVLTSCTHFRDGTGKKETFTKAAYSPAYDHVSDCMGPFLTWWRQNIPAVGNTALEEDGQPMRSWWPFLYY